uniref:Uncharacterized protein n=1 Tax=uncultured prokaryote TaxID=198431 RepID=A0A0H5Q7H5_9ZZZZ|nr:hypothetical protein [uncultured prokaryote]
MATVPNRRQYGRVVLSYGGTIRTGQGWSCTLTSSTAFHVPTAAQLKDMLDTMTGIFVSWWGGSGGQLNSADVVLDDLKAYFYPAGATSATAQAEVTGIAAAGAKTGTMPTQVSLVHTLLTGLPGRHRRGRNYVPATGVSLTNHQLTDALTNTSANTFASLLESLNGTAIGDTFWLTSVSANLAEAAPPTVIQVRVDSEADIQRRRADKVAADFVHAATVPA